MSARLPRLLVITDWSIGHQALLERLRSVLSLGPEVGVQQRHPGAAGRQFLEEARALQALCAERGNPLFINTRLDVALLLGAHFHLTSAGPGIDEVRALLPSDRLLSVAVHDEQEALRARAADAAVVSPVFAPGSKPGDSRPHLGPLGFRRLAGLARVKSYALGGITPQTAQALPRDTPLAVVSAVWRAPHPAAAAQALLQLHP